MTPLPKLAAPAQRALASAGITCLEDIAKFTKEEILNLHGVGKNAIKEINSALQAEDLAFKEPQA